jgi:enolase
VPLYKHIAKLAGISNMTLPLPAFNIINGGAHAGNAIPFQEFMIIPTGAKSFKEAMKIGSEVYQQLKGIIKSRFGQDGAALSRTPVLIF